MKHTDNLGVRMKEYYENIPKTKLMRRTPVAIRIDGKAFHTFTRGLKKPFDEILVKTMQDTMSYLCENIQGCVFGYTQSDEITLILTDYKHLNTSAWFDYEVQKMCSISASMATMAFNKALYKNIDDYSNSDEVLEKLSKNPTDKEVMSYFEVLKKANKNGAMFDSRCFNIPKEEVCNLLYWRQLDAIRNSIQMVGQSNFSHKQLHGKSCNDIVEMLKSQKGIDWNDIPTYLQRGSCCVKQSFKLGEFQRSNWRVEKDMPLLKDENREYVEKLIYDIGERPIFRISK